MVFVQDVGDVPEGGCVLFSAHGVSPAVREEAVRRGLEVVDATCPFVQKVHREVRETVNVPASYMEELYNLRMHLDRLREEIARSVETRA